jgi:hypothetical protein
VLESSGVTLPESGLDLTASVHARASPRADGPAIDLRIEGLTAGAGDQQLQLERLAVTGLHGAHGRTMVDSIEIAGPRVAATKLPDGALRVAGVTFREAASRPAPKPSEPADAPGDSVPWPDVMLKHLEWTGCSLRIRDDSLGEPAELGIEDLGLRGQELGLGRELPPGHLTASLRVPGAIEQVRAEITTNGKRDSLGVALHLTAEGVTAASLSPWLARAGVTPVLEDGSFRLDASATVKHTAEHTIVDARVENVRFEDGADLLVGMRRFEVLGFRVGGATLHLGTITIDQPFVAARLEADRALRAAGMRFGTATPPAAPAAPAATAVPRDVSPAQPRSTTSREPLAITFPSHGPITLRDCAVTWTDEGRPGMKPRTFATDARISEGVAGDAKIDGELDFRIGPGVADLQVRASLSRTTRSLDLDANITGEKIRGAGFDPLLPPGIACTLREGSLRAKLHCELARDGTVRLLAEGVQLSDLGENLLEIGTVDLRAPEIGADLVHVSAAKVLGIKAVVATTNEGLHVPGFRIDSAATSAAPTAPAAAVALSAAAKQALAPLLEVDELDVQLERLTWTERRDTDGEPLVASLRLQLAEPFKATADDGADAPARLLLTAQASPLLRELRIEGDIVPYAVSPVADLSVRAAGIDMTAIPRIAPSLTGVLEGAVDDASLEADLHLRLDLRRREGRHFDFSRPFGFDLLLENVAMRGAGEVLFGVDAIEADVRALDPERGDLLLRSLEIDGPMIRVRRTPEGLETFGVRLVAAPPDAGSEARETPAEPAPPTPATAAPENGAPRGEAPPALAAATAPTPELTIGHVQVQALSFDYVDSTTTPPTVLPFEQVDLRIDNASTLVLTEPRQFSFSATVIGGNVELPRRVVSSSVITGIIGSAAQTITGSKSATERRPLVEEMTVEGSLQVFPSPRGHVEASVQAFELPALRGLAKQGEVEIGDGIFDLDAHAQFSGGDGMFLRATPTFTWLSVSEPPNGPISTYLKLPAALDTVLFLIRNESGEQVLPLRVVVPADDLSGAAIGSAVVETLTKLIAEAVASSPWRVAGALTGVFGMDTGRDRALPTWVFGFDAGEKLPEAGDVDALVATLAGDPDLMVTLTHELGAGDLTRAAALANPPTARVAEAVAHLQAERDALAHEHAGTAARVTSLLVAGQVQAGRALHRDLAAMDDDLGAMEHTLDDALRMLAGESQRAVERRQRRGAVELAEGRLEAVRRLLCGRIGDDELERVVWRRPRPVAVEELDGGGRVVAKVRRRASLGSAERPKKRDEPVTMSPVFDDR